jgi:hypothetical protein
LYPFGIDTLQFVQERILIGHGKMDAGKPNGKEVLLRGEADRL